MSTTRGSEKDLILAVAQTKTTTSDDTQFATSLDTIKCTYTALDKIIQWPFSRHNKITKKEVIEKIIFYIEKGEDGELELSTGAYSDATKNRHVGCFVKTYILKILNGKVYLFCKYKPDQCVAIKSPAKLKYYIPTKKIKLANQYEDIPAGDYYTYHQDIYNYYIHFNGLGRMISKTHCIRVV